MQELDQSFDKLDFACNNLIETDVIIIQSQNREQEQMPKEWKQNALLLTMNPLPAI